MAGEISLKIGIDASQAKREIAGLEKVSNKSDRGMANAGRDMGKDGAAGVATVNRGLERMLKNADSANKKVRELEASLKRVGQRKGSILGFVESGAASDSQLKELEELRRYERNKGGSLGHWRQVAADRQIAVEQGRGEQPAPGRQGWLSQIKGSLGDMAGGGVKSALPEGALGDLAGGLISKFAGPLAMMGVGAAAAKFISMAYDAASHEQKSMADLVPRLSLGAGGFHQDPAAYMGHLRDIARPLGYSGYEALQIQGAMSTGGSRGAALNRDTKTAMQFSRLFGIDAGQGATMLASGQRMGAAADGDAKKFAELLARQIAITGLGPRAQEVMEGTLSLMNQQMQSAGQTDPVAIMALQTAMNKTGIPGLQGSYGANLLSQMNQHVTNPGGAAQESLFFHTYRALGVKSYPAMLRAQEKGIAYPGFLGQLVAGMEQHGSPDMVQNLLKMTLGVPMTLSARLQQQAPGHLISRMLRGKSFAQAAKLLQLPGILDPATAQAMGLPGNQVRKGEAMANDFMARAGTPIVKGAGSIADRAEKSYTTLLRIATADESLGGKFDKLYEYFTGAKPGTVHVGAKTERAVVAGAAELQKGDTHYQAPSTRGMRWNARLHRWEHAAALPGGRPTPAFSMPGGGSAEFKVKGYREEERGGHIVRVIIEEHGMVSAASHAALKRAIHSCIGEHAQAHAQVHPKSNHRGNR